MRDGLYEKLGSIQKVFFNLFYLLMSTIVCFPHRILINLIGIFRLKHLFNINEAEKEKWKNEEELNKLDEKMKAITKLCLLPEQTFFCVLKFCRL